MELIHERCAGLDVHKKSVVACIRVATGGTVTRAIETFFDNDQGLYDYSADVEIVARPARSCARIHPAYLGPPRPAPVRTPFEPAPNPPPDHARSAGALLRSPESRCPAPRMRPPPSACLPLKTSSISILACVASG